MFATDPLEADRSSRGLPAFGGFIRLRRKGKRAQIDTDPDPNRLFGLCFKQNFSPSLDLQTFFPPYAIKWFSVLKTNHFIPLIT